MNQILVFGSCNFDNIYSVPHITQPGETQSSAELNVRLGGKGYNQAVAVRRTGANVWLAGMVGEDGQPFIDECTRLGIHVDYLRSIPRVKTGHAVIQVSNDAENSILLFGGANQCISKEYIDDVLSHFGKGDYILLQNEVNNLDYIIDRAYTREMNVILNPSPFNDIILSCDLKKVTWLFINEIEAKQIIGYKSAGNLVDGVRFKFPDCNIVLTLGADGADCLFGNTAIHQKAFHVSAVDTTGAGDCFSGYFIGLLTMNHSGRKALRMAAAAAALCITKAGAAESIPELSSVETFVKENNNN